MRGWLVIVLLAAAATVAVLVVAIVRTHDDSSDALRACIEDSDGFVVSGPDVLGPLRDDLEAGSGPRLVGDLRIGENAARLYEGTGYRLLVMRARGSEPLRGDTPLRAYEDTSAYGIVAIERDPVEGALRACAEVTG